MINGGQFVYKIPFSPVSQLAYAVFLACYSYMILVRTPPTPSPAEIYVALCMMSFMFELVRTYAGTESVDLFSARFAVWSTKNRWNLPDAVAIIYFFAGMILRWVVL